jgi:hypothetical protein
VTVPGLQRTTALRFVLRCARDTPFKLTRIHNAYMFLRVRGAHSPRIIRS